MVPLKDLICSCKDLKMAFDLLTDEKHFLKWYLKMPLDITEIDRHLYVLTPLIVLWSKCTMVLTIVVDD